MQLRVTTIVEINTTDTNIADFSDYDEEIMIGVDSAIRTGFDLFEIEPVEPSVAIDMLEPEHAALRLAHEIELYISNNQFITKTWYKKKDELFKEICSLYGIGYVETATKAAMPILTREASKEARLLLSGILQNADWSVPIKELPHTEDDYKKIDWITVADGLLTSGSSFNTNRGNTIEYMNLAEHNRK